jgi:hypothetical protein
LASHGAELAHRIDRCNNTGTAGIAIRRILNDYSIGISLPKP